jgi:DNA-binding NarL/FixJ family response regulator
MTKSTRRPKSQIRVLIVSPDNMTGELLSGAFRKRGSDFAVKTLVGTSQHIIERLDGCKSDVALISDELQDGPKAGFKVLQKVRAAPQSTPAIMLLKSSKPDSVIEAFREGARGIFYRSHSMKALTKCIRTVHQGQFWISTDDLEHVMSGLCETKPFRIVDSNGLALLTRREEDVVRLVVEGMKNREIAQNLQISDHSVRNYLYRIFEKLGVSSRVELILRVSAQQNPGDSPH